MSELEHERLDVYQAAIQFLVLADAAAASLPRGRGYLADQLRRAASSISFNIAEGAGEFAPADKARLNDESPAGRVVLLRIVAMLTAMVVKLSGSGSGSSD